MKIIEILEMHEPEYTYDAAMKTAEEKRNSVVVQLKNKRGLNAFRVFAKDQFEQRDDQEKYDIKHFVDGT